MRLSVLAALTAVLLAPGIPVATAVHAEEVRYKDRPKDRPADQGAYKRPPDRPPTPQPPVYKPPSNPQPPSPPPSKDHPEKRPPEPREKPDPYEPPTGGGGGWAYRPPCPPPSCPHPFPVWPVEEVVAPDPVVPPVPVAADLNSVLLRTLRAMRVEGFAGEVIVARSGQIQFGAAFDAGGYRDIGTMTEAFTAWAVYRLAESNRLTPASTLARWFADAPPDKAGITVAELLGHTSGLGSTHAGAGAPDRNAAVARLLAQQLAFPPGRSFMHSDDGYVLLAALIEAASGMPYQRYLTQCGAVSSDMTNTVFLEPGDWGRRGASGILSTANDLCRWSSRFAGGDYIADEITRPRQWTADGVGIGYAWSSATDGGGSTKWSQGTGDSDDNAIVVLYPNSLSLVVTSDRYNGDVPWSERVANSLEPFLRAWPSSPIVPLQAYARD